MSVEVYVLSNKLLYSTNALQSNIDQLGFQLTVLTDRDWTVARGHVSASWKGQEAGFECSPAQLAGLKETYALNLGGPWDHAICFRFGTLPGCAGALIAAAAYAHATNGVLFETEDLKIFSPSDAITHARESELEVVRWEEIQDRVSRELRDYYKKR